MYNSLKARIIEKYGRQNDFARVVSVTENKVSRIIHCRDELGPDQKKVWAKKLDAKTEEIFPTE